jgi:hypothetical protein
MAPYNPIANDDSDYWLRELRTMPRAAPPPDVGRRRGRAGVASSHSVTGRIARGTRNVSTINGLQWRPPPRQQCRSRLRL